MARNNALNKARYTSDNTDEWYTTDEAVEEELSHYEKHFKNKVVLCNCDDPHKSAFARYFLRRFNVLGLKQLICTSYGESKVQGMHPKQLSLFPESSEYLIPERGYVMIIDSMPGGKGKLISDKVIAKELSKKGVIRRLKGDGDFSSDECVRYLKKADILVTNPPFSKLTTLFSLLVKYQKKYLFICNQLAITHKEIFPHIKQGKAWIGHRFGTMAFKVPDDTKLQEKGCYQDKHGQKWKRLGNIMWLTNLDNNYNPPSLELTATYSKDQYPVYDGTDVIHIRKIADIPKDYMDVMGVPVTYLKYHNPNKYEIVGEANHGSDNEYDLFMPKINGKEMFKRILIKRK